MDKHIVRVSKFFFPRLPDFAIAVPIVQFKLVQVFQKFLVEFGLQFKSKTGEQLCCS